MDRFQGQRQRLQVVGRGECNCRKDAINTPILHLGGIDAANYQRMTRALDPGKKGTLLQDSLSVRKEFGGVGPFSSQVLASRSVATAACSQCVD